MRYLLILQNLLPTILECFYVNVGASSLLTCLSFLFQATTLYPSKRKVSDKEGEFYFRYAAFGFYQFTLAISQHI